VVTDHEKGFDYEGCEFPSLSAIAMHITGTKWNGHLFFGLTKEKTNETSEPGAVQTRTSHFSLAVT
jgi:hypothetical protein